MTPGRIRILSYWNEDIAPRGHWASLHEQSWYWSARPRGGRWRTGHWIEAMKSIFEFSSTYLLDVDRYHPSKEGYYLIYYGSSHQVYENQGLAFVTPSVIDACNRGSSKLLIVFCHETWDKNVPFREWYWNFCTLLSDMGLKRAHSVVILTATHLGSTPHPDSRCDIVYYPWFEAQLQIEMKKREMTLPPVDMNRKVRRYINLNRMIRPHRFLMLCYLKYRKLDQYGYLSWKNPNSMTWREIVDGTGDGQHDHSWKSQLANFDREGFGFFHFVNTMNVMPSIDLDDLEDPSTMPAAPSRDPLQQWVGADEFYFNSWTDIVSETHFELHGDVFPTEKTFKPMAYGLPFIFNASRGHLRHVKSLGYQSFPELFDENYDNMPGNLSRIAEIGNQIDKLCSSDQKLAILKSPETQAKIEYNQNQFWRKDHSDQLGKLLYEAWTKGRA